MNQINVVSGIMVEGGKMNSEASAQIRACLNEITPGTQILIGITPHNSIAGALNIVPIDKLLQDSEHLEKMARTEVDPSQVEAVIDLLNELSTWLPYAGKLQANALYYWRIAQANVMEKIPEWIKESTPTDRKRWIDGQCAEYESMHKQLERITAAITHRCEILRSFLSYEKGLLTLNGTQK